MKILAFAPMHRKTLRGFADVAHENGMIFLGCSVHESGGKRWANPPSRLMIGPDRKPLLDDRGKPRYEPAVEFVNKAVRWTWSQAVVTALSVYLESKAATFEGGGDERRRAASTSREESEAGE